MEIIIGIVLTICIVLGVLFKNEIYYRFMGYVKLFKHNGITFYLTKDSWKQLCEDSIKIRVYLQGWAIDKLKTNPIDSKSNNPAVLVYFTQTEEEQKNNSTSWNINLEEIT